MTVATPDSETEAEAVQRVTAMEAVTLIERAVGGAVAAKMELADRMRDGRLAVFSPRAWVSSRRNVASSWRQEPDEEDPAFDVETDIEVHARVWRLSVQWLSDQSAWRWPSGRFTVVHRRGANFHRVMIEEVQFERAAILQLAAILSGVSSPAETSDLSELDDDVRERTTSSTRNSRGRAHALLILEILRMASEGELRDKKYEKMAPLSRHIASVMKRKREEFGVFPLATGSIETIVRVLHPVLRDGAPYEVLANRRYDLRVKTTV